MSSRSSLWLLLLTCAACAPEDLDRAGEDCSGERWVGAWAAAPSDLTEEVIADESLRLVLTPLRGGEVARVRLSNRLGAAPLRLTHVHLGVSAEGAATASLRPSSQQPVRFDGADEVTIPAGEDVVSDPVDLSFSALDRLAVSVFVPAPGAALTRHSLAMQTSFRAPGDVAAAEGGSAYAGTMTDRPLVVGLDVLASGTDGVIVALGDSLTDGDQSTSGGRDADSRYPDALARRLAEVRADLTPVNLGIAGNRVLSGPLLPSFGPALLERLGPDVLAREDVTDVVLLQGINDLGIPPGASAAELLDGLAEVVAQLDGPRVFVGTLTPAGGTSGLLGTYAAAEDARQEVNAAIRDGAVGDRVIDFDAAVRDPDDPSRIAAAYDGGDGLHMSAEGYARMAEAVDLGALAGRRCAP